MYFRHYLLYFQCHLCGFCLHLLPQTRSYPPYHFHYLHLPLHFRLYHFLQSHGCFLSLHLLRLLKLATMR